MSLLAPIILDNGTGYSKLGYVEGQKQAIFSLMLALYSFAGNSDPSL